MANKIMGKDFYVDIKPYELAGQTFNVLRVCATYRKNYGFYAYYKPGWRTDYDGFGCILVGANNPLERSTDIDVTPAAKNSQKTINEMGAALELAKDVIAALFDKREWTMLNNVIHNVAKCGYTENFKQQAEKFLNENKQSIKPKNEEEKVMANEVKAADLIGKKIVIAGTANYYQVLSVEGDTLKTEFHRGTADPVAVPLPFANIKGFLDSGVYVIEGEQPATKATDEVEEVEDIQPEAPKAAPKDKAEEPKAKTEKPKAEPKATAPKGKLTYETYVNKKGKTCAKIKGFAEDDAVYTGGERLHGSASYERDKDGGKVFYLVFGPRYAKAAENVCKVLNSAKTAEQKMAECELIIDMATKELEQLREESKAKREERRAAAAEAGGDKTYTVKEVADILKSVMAGGKLPKDIELAMAA